MCIIKNSAVGCRLLLKYAVQIQRKMGFCEAKWGRSGAMLIPDELVFTFAGSHVCATFGENRSRNASVRVPTDGYTLTDR